MSPPSNRVTAFAILLLLTVAVTGSLSSPPPAMFIPLRFTAHKASLRPVETNRRLSEGGNITANAQMPLHDNLLTNGYYTAHIYIGTPSQEFALIVDSGSSVTYVPCVNCEKCGNHQDPRFQPDLSKTYEPIKCHVDCVCDDKNKQCTYERNYAEMSSSSGLLGTDLISFGEESVLEPQRIVFGCETTETGDIFSQHADGIMGLGHGRLSIMDQLVRKGAISDSFSLCYGGMDVGGGAMVLGGIPHPPDMTYSSSNPRRSPYYNLDLKEIHVAGEVLRIRAEIFDRKHGTVLDSGTTYAYLPKEAYVPFRDALSRKLRSLKQINGPDPNYKDLCYSGAGSDPLQLSMSFPKVNMVFGNGQKMTLSPENYLFRHAKVAGAYCLGIFQNSDPTILLGGIIVRNTLVTYDRQNDRIGFWKTNCSELWDNLDAATSPPTEPLAPGTSNSTVGVPLASSPSTDHLFSGQMQVGLITFYLSLNISYRDLAPHIEELEGLIAHDLEVDKHQVRIMNYSSEGNITQIKWAILPAGSADSISNTTATGIIARLIQHRVSLPKNFGSYQLLEWNVEPPSKRSHLWGVTVWILSVIILGLFALLAFHLWKRKYRGPSIYRPVDAAAPEQELQLQPM